MIRDLEHFFQCIRELPQDVDASEWLKANCDDAELRDEVASLLRAHAEVVRHSERFRSAKGLEPEKEAKETGALSEEPPSGAFGPYRPVSQLGRGGMSVVYRALREGAPFEQTVALKVMPPFFADGDFKRRFEVEVRVLAQLHHPNITRLLDGGVTSTGLPYLAMELIEGERFDAYCDGRRLSVSSRLRLLLQVFEAVDYAHRHLIVHRDLKPANILIDGQGVAKLLDFGTAAMLSAEAQETVTRARMLTPRYASPEQLRGARMGMATDIFSLGVILYETLTGAWPYGDPTSMLAEFQRVAGAEPRPLPAVLTPESAAARGAELRQLARALKGDLTAIVFKALQHDPARRYGTVREFAMDLVRYLERRPVSARRQSFGYRCSRFLRRNCWRVAAVSAAAALVAASGVYSYRQREREQRRLAQLRTLNQSLLTDVYREVSRLPGAGKVSLLIAERVRNNLDALFNEFPADRETRAELAAAYLQLAEIQGEPFLVSLGDSEAAAKNYRKAAGLLRGIHLFSNQNKGLWLRSQLGIAALQIRSGSYRDATLTLAPAVETARQLAGAAPALEINGRPAAYWCVRTHILLGHAQLRQADVPRDVQGVRQALGTFETALQIANEMSLPAAAGAVQQYIGYAYQLLADFTGDARYLNLALEAHRKAMESARADYLSRPAPQRRRDYADRLTDYGWVLHLCRRSEAEATLFEALAQMKEAADASPESEELRLDLANSYARLGAAEVETHHLRSGMFHLLRAGEQIHLPALIRPSDRELAVLFARVQESLSMGFQQQGFRPEAVRALDQAIAVVESGHSVPPWRIAQLREERAKLESSAP
jgi:serine/threonine protein kinase